MKHSKMHTLKKSVSYSDNSVVSVRILENAAGGITLFAFDTDQRLSEHSAPFDAVVQILDGKGKITIAGEEFLLNEGEMIIMPKDIPHAVYAVEKFKMQLIMLKG
jgi:quercetin dioxygenase-like cupin family protein